MSIPSSAPASRRRSVRADPVVANPAPSRGNRAPIGWRLPLLAGLFAFVLDAIGSWIPSLWGDESASVLSAQRSLPSLIHEVTHVDAVHATYYALLHGWIHFFGTSAFSVRLPSAIAGGLAVAGVVVLVRQFGRGPRFAVAAATLTALLPRLDYAGGEARAYSADAAIAVWLVVLAVATLSGRMRPRTGWTLIALLLVFGTCLFLYQGLMIAVIGLMVRFAVRGPTPPGAGSRRRRAQVLGWVASSLAVLVFASPVIVFAMLEKSQVAFLAHRTVTVDAVLGQPWFGSGVLFPVLAWVVLALGAVAALARARRPFTPPFSFAFARLRRRGIASGSYDDAEATAHEDTAELRLGAVAALWAFIPLAVLMATAPMLHLFTARYLTFAAPGIALLLACAVEALYRRRAWWGIVALTALLAASLPSYFQERTPYAQNGSDWSQLAALVHQQAHRGDDVLFDGRIRPSRMPRSSLRLYPRDYVGLRDVALVAPWWQTTSWHDDALTIRQAVEDGRVRSATVWVVEGDYAGHLDRDGVTALYAHGYRAVAHWKLNVDELIEFKR